MEGKEQIFLRDSEFLAYDQYLKVRLQANISNIALIFYGLCLVMGYAHSEFP